jgi:hypothetical protein
MKRMPPRSPAGTSYLVNFSTDDMLVSMATRRPPALLALAAGLLLAGCGGQPSAGGSPHPSPVTSVSSASLLTYAARGTDLGAGWTDAPSTDGTNLTVDNSSHPCRRPYPSDTLRLARNGVTIVNSSDPSQVANDVVYYRDHGAEQALNEIRDTLNACTSYQQINSEGATITIDIHKSAASSSSLGDDRVAIDRRATLSGRSIYSVVFFIRVGEYVTSVFTLSGDPTAAGRLAGLAAAASTNRLKAAPAS